MGYLYLIGDKDDFESRLEECKSTYPDATHHCYAWRLNPTNPQEFAQDDGEPGGTAGLPILNQLKSFEVINAGLIVVRYYGGTNLGKSGLIQAYGRAAEECLQKALLHPIQLVWNVKISYPYAEQNQIEQLIHRFNLKELESAYTENVSLLLACPLNKKTELQKQLAGLEHRNIKSEFLEKSYV